ncbi:ATP-binding cassette domain-containing protein [Helicobacter sp. 13S00401-1]|uniref:ABC transporter ATP-binding protein n=1 Tax=Helicobacter sp. 13S00401-1 TaxID=1905758 RepID=UPI000BA7BC42|nr:ATP-binding cassette domain-containing protein [Helicobacter sp. 13S00401-1]
MENIIEVSNLSTAYGDFKVHDNISFKVKRGEIFAILGGSGSGKTTLLQSMIFINKPKSGTIKLEGIDIWKIRPSRRYEVIQKFGVVFQFGALFSSLNVLQNITIMLDEYSKYPKHLYHDIAVFWLENVGLSMDVCEKMPDELSGGMKKRVALARALCVEPTVLFLDEPTSGLDPASAGKFDMLIRDLRDRFGVTIVMVTHDLDSVIDVTDRFILLEKKKIIFEGTWKEFAVLANSGKIKDSIFNSYRGERFWKH